MKFWHVAVIAFLLPYCAVAEDARQRSITVSGLAEQEFAPDIAKFSVNITGKAKAHGDAKAAHDKMLKTFMELVGKYKIEDRDLNTGFSSISPFYEYQQNTNKQVLAGYNAQTLVNITIRDLKQVGPFQDSLATGGFDNFQGPMYTLDKMFTYNDKVLANAVENAKQKASSIAAKIGEQIDRAVDIRENNSGGYEPQPFRAQAMLAKVASESSAVQPAGIINIRSNVTATFSLK